MKRAILIILLSAVMAPVAARARDHVLILTPYFRDLRTVTVMAGERSLTMLVDTGGGATAISPAVAAAIGCTPRGQDIGHRMTGEAVTFARCDALTLRAGDWSHTFEPIGVFDIGALLPKELPSVDGVLALDAFRGRVVTLDWAANRITVIDRGRERQAIAASGLPARIATGETGRFLEAFVPIGSTIGPTSPLWFLLDSGNLRGTLVAESVMRDKLLPVTTSGDAMLRFIAPARPAWTTPFASAALTIDGALGTDFLKRGPITLDLRLQ